MSDGTLNFPHRSVPPSAPSVDRTKIWIDDTGEAKLTDSAGVTTPFKSIFGANYTYANNNVASINDTTTFQNYLTLNYAGLDTSPGTQYRIGLTFGWNYSVATRNYIARFLLNGVQFGPDFQVEPKDGGTDISHWETVFFVVDGATLSGSGTLEFEFRAQSAGDVATTNFASYELFRVV